MNYELRNIVLGSGRFNVVDGYMATVRGLAAVSSQYIGAVILEGQGPFTALSISFVVAVIPPIKHGSHQVVVLQVTRGNHLPIPRIHGNRCLVRIRRGVVQVQRILHLRRKLGPRVVHRQVTSGSLQKTLGNLHLQRILGSLHLLQRIHGVQARRITEESSRNLS